MEPGHVRSSVYDRILFPTDGSQTAKRAGEHAMAVAERFEAELMVCFVIEQHYLYAGPSGPRDLWDEIVGRAREVAEKRTDQTVREAKSRGIPVIREIVEEPRVADAILEVAEARDADAIVMGTHGRSAVKRFLMGSVAERVLRRSDAPVLLVPAGGEED